MNGLQAENSCGAAHRLAPPYIRPWGAGTNGNHLLKLLGKETDVD